MNLNDGQPYLFHGEFWDSANYESAFVNAYLESKLIGDDDRTLNDTLLLNGNSQDATIDDIDYINGTTEKIGDLDSQDGSETWFESSQGYRYPGTYSFEGEVGLTGTDISMINSVSTTSNTRVSEIVDKHRDILNQTNSGGNDYCRFYFIDEINSGVVEFWFRTVDATDKTCLYFLGAGGSQIYFCVENDLFKYYGIPMYRQNKSFDIGHRAFWDMVDFNEEKVLAHA